MKDKTKSIIVWVGCLTLLLSGVAQMVIGSYLLTVRVEQFIVMMGGLCQAALASGCMIFGVWCSLPKKSDKHSRSEE